MHYHVLQPVYEMRTHGELYHQREAAKHEPLLARWHGAMTLMEVWKAMVTIDFQQRSAFTSAFGGPLRVLTTNEPMLYESVVRRDCKCVMMCDKCRMILFWLRVHDAGFRIHSTASSSIILPDTDALTHLNELYRSVYPRAKKYTTYQAAMEEDRLAALGPRGSVCTTKYTLVQHPLTITSSYPFNTAKRKEIMLFIQSQTHWLDMQYRSNSLYGLWKSEMLLGWMFLWSMTKAYYGSLPTRRLYTPEQYDFEPCSKRCYYCAIRQLYIDRAHQLISNVVEFSVLKERMVSETYEIFHSLDETLRVAEVDDIPEPITSLQQRDHTEVKTVQADRLQKQIAADPAMQQVEAAAAASFTPITHIPPPTEINWNQLKRTYSDTLSTEQKERIQASMPKRQRIQEKELIARKSDSKETQEELYQLASSMKHTEPIDQFTFIEERIWTRYSSEYEPETIKRVCNRLYASMLLQWLKGIKCIPIDRRKQDYLQKDDFYYTYHKPYLKELLSKHPAFRWMDMKASSVSWDRLKYVATTTRFGCNLLTTLDALREHDIATYNKQWIPSDLIIPRPSSSTIVDGGM